MTLNKQGPNGIEWTDYTWNVVQGCQHGCTWTMPDGDVAECYAKTVADKFRSDKFMPNGFAHHYFNADRLADPLRLKKPARIFLDSTSDLMGHWVPDGEIEQVLDVCRQAHWHTFQLLTKNPVRLPKFDFPSNVWVGVSAPPTAMFGRELNPKARDGMLHRTFDALAKLSVPVRWMSIEPLSFNIAPYLETAPLEWVVIGAATNGRKAYQPDPSHVANVLDVMDRRGIPVFFKGNLEWPIWREKYPVVETTAYAMPTPLF